MAEIQVTTLQDQSNGSTNGRSLREAIAQANSGDTITFSQSGIINLTLGELTINKNLTIDGDTDNDDSTADITIDAGGNSRVFEVADTSIGGRRNVTFDGLTITGGQVSGNGGGIYNRENLTLNNSTISGNSASSNGGGIHNKVGILNISNSTISDNRSNSDGGGIYSNGGTFINIGSFGAAVNLSNSTISGNTASAEGGGVYNGSDGSGSTANITNSTISYNSASQGGGIYNRDTADISSTIIASNTASSSNPDVDGSFTNSGNNLIGDATGSTGFTVDNILIGDAASPIDPLLGSLQDNGGPTQTQALQFGSPAINTGSNPDNLTTDQRGEARVQLGAIDIGAIESASFNALTVDNLSDEEDGDISTGDLSLREALALISDGGTIDFSNSLSGSIDLSLGELMIDKSVTINGPGADQLSIDAGGNSRVFNIDDGSGLFSTVTIDGLTITGGTATDGGGIYNREDLTISNSTISGNSSSSGGGGISNFQSTVAITNSTISGNSARFGGGGVSNLFGTATISNITISGNSAGNDGGGVLSFYGVTDISNSTISGNSAGNNGGGLSRFYGNTTVVSTIIADNTASSSGPDVNGTFTDDGNNLIGDATGSTGFTVDNILIGDATSPIDPLLGPLQDNGGSTETQALQPGSPGINAGSNPDNLTTDQRGEDRVQQGAVDIGAYESDLVLLFDTLLVDNLSDEDDGDLSDGDVSLREALKFIADGGTITFDNSLINETIALTEGALVVDKSVTINGLGADQLTIDAQGNSLVFKVDDRDDDVDATVEISGLTITGGDGGYGGGIYNRENLTLTGITISGNTAGEVGAGIFSRDSTVNLTNSTISGNTAGIGAGIATIASNLNLTNSTVSGNTADIGGGDCHR